MTRVTATATAVTAAKKRVKPRTTEYIKWVSVMTTDKSGKARRTRKLVSHNSAYLNDGGRHQARFDKLYERDTTQGFVPKAGTVQELLRHAQDMYYTLTQCGINSDTVHGSGNDWKSGIFDNPAIKMLSDETRAKLCRVRHKYEHHDRDADSWWANEPKRGHYEYNKDYTRALDRFFENYKEENAAWEQDQEETVNLLDAALDEIVQRCPLR
jgi:hypothetical protein